MIGYSGWIGHRNIGDEAIYQANVQLFPEFNLHDASKLSDYDHLIVGGGTIFPKFAVIQDNLAAGQTNHALGVGVRNPSFWNQSFGSFDMGYLLEKYGTKRLFANPTARYLLRGVGQRTDSVTTQPHVVSSADFNRIRQFDFDFIGVRGPISHDILSLNGIPSRIVGDTALMLRPTEYSQSASNKIAVTLRSGDYQWDSDGSYRDRVIEFCQRHQAEYDFVFLPFYPPDLQVCIDAVDQIESAYLVDYCTQVDVQATIDLIASCDLVISDKLHATVLAACCSVPFISLEYRPKNLDFAQSVGMEAFNIRSDRVTVDRLEERASRALGSDILSNQLEDRVELYRTRLTSATQAITSMINSCRTGVVEQG